MRFQQITSPVTAKGYEDTALYRFNRLVSLNEVGADPSRFGTPVAEFHAAMAERQRTYPHALSATSTHDTKRSEDVRARINVLSEIPDEWRQPRRPLAEAEPEAPDDGRRPADAGREHRVPDLPDPRRGVADRRGAAPRLPLEGDPRGEIAHELDQSEHAL